MQVFHHFIDIGEADGFDLAGFDVVDYFIVSFYGFGGELDGLGFESDADGLGGKLVEEYSNGFLKGRKALGDC